MFKLCSWVRVFCVFHLKAFPVDSVFALAVRMDGRLAGVGRASRGASSWGLRGSLAARTGVRGPRACQLPSQCREHHGFPLFL